MIARIVIMRDIAGFILAELYHRQSKPATNEKGCDQMMFAALIGFDGRNVRLLGILRVDYLQRVIRNLHFVTAERKRQVIWFGISAHQHMEFGIRIRHYHTP